MWERPRNGRYQQPADQSEDARLGHPEDVDAIESLLAPAELLDTRAVLDRPSRVAAVPGLYAWYFRKPPPGVPTTGCHTHAGLVLLYVGISPKAPPRNGASASRQSVRSRLQYHYRGNAEGSTLRLSLGALLADELGLELRRVGSGSRMTFHSGETLLSRWMAENTRVAWAEHPRPWEPEHELITSVLLPLNLDQNRNHPFHPVLSELRSRQRELARALPVLAD